MSNRPKDPFEKQPEDGAYTDVDDDYFFRRERAGGGRVDRRGVSDFVRRAIENTVGSVQTTSSLSREAINYLLQHGDKGKKEVVRIVASEVGDFLGGTDLDEVTLDEPSIRSKGAFLGAAGIMVFDDRRNMVDVAHNAMEFFAEESCGKCFPCRIGTHRLAERLVSEFNSTSKTDWYAEVEDIGETMMATSACGLGMAAPNITRSLQKYFPEQVTAHLQSVSQ